MPVLEGEQVVTVRAKLRPERSSSGMVRRHTGDRLQTPRRHLRGLERAPDSTCSIIGPGEAEMRRFRPAVASNLRL
jgi:hypothetical protein